MLCPKDNLVCEKKYVGEVELDVCNTCQGVWIEKKEVKVLVQSISTPNASGVDEELKAWDVTESAGTAPKDFWIEDDLVCPRDGTAMRKHYFAGTHIGVDQCHVCKAFWLDGGELQAVARSATPNPALESAYRAMFQERTDWHAEIAKIHATTEKVVMSVGNPVYGLLLVGGFLVQTFIEHYQQLTNET